MLNLNEMNEMVSNGVYLEEIFKNSSKEEIKNILEEYNKNILEEDLEEFLFYEEEDKSFLIKNGFENLIGV